MVADRRAPAIAGALAIVYLVWGSTYLGIAVAIESMPPLLHAGVRFLVAGAFLLLAHAPPLGRARRPTAASGARRCCRGRSCSRSATAACRGASSTWPPASPRSSSPRSRSGWRSSTGSSSAPACRSLAVVGVAVGFLGVGVLVNPGSADGLHLGGTVALLHRGGRLVVGDAPLPGPAAHRRSARRRGHADALRRRGAHRRGRADRGAERRSPSRT